MIVTHTPAVNQTIVAASQPPARKKQAETTESSKLTQAGHHESALISCLLIAPEYVESLPLLPSDFCEFGCGEAYEVIQFDYRHTGDARPTFLRDQLKVALGDDVHPGGLVCDWITQYVFPPHCYFYASKVAAASYARAVEQSLSDGIQEIRFGQDVAEYRRVRCDQNEQISTMEKRLKDLL